MSDRKPDRLLSWSVVNVVIVVAALFPVLWILMLSLKTPATVADGKFFPTEISFENYEGIFSEDVFTKAPARPR
jgi:multiple sugar transport system permease protein